MNKVLLESICSFTSGFAFRSSGFNEDGIGLPVIRIQNVNSVSPREMVYWDKEFKKKFVVQKGDLLLSLSGSFRVMEWQGSIALLNQRVVRLEPNQEVHQRWLFWSISSKLLQIQRMGKHALVNNVTMTDLRKLEIPLPSLDEQKRIAAILDKADVIRQKRKEAIKLTEELLRSTFLEMFGDPVTNPKGWPTKPLGDLCTKVTDGTHQSPNWVPQGVPFLFVSNIIDGELTLNTKKFISEAEYKVLTKTSPIELGDILYTTVGSYGNAAMVKTTASFCFQRHIAHIKPDSNQIEARYLLGFLQTNGARFFADCRVRGVAQKTLNLAELKKFSVPIPPPNFQKRYASVREQIKKQQSSQSKLLLESGNLFESLVQKAFKGEL